MTEITTMKCQEEILVEDTLEETKIKVMAQLNDKYTSAHPSAVWRNAKKELENSGLKKGATIDTGSAIFKVLSLQEFEKGILMNLGLPEYLQTLSIELSTRLQTEYDCNTASKQTTAHLVAHSMCRILELQKKINDYLSIGAVTETGVKYLAVISKELDRAQRHYYSAIQTLQLMKRPLINVTVKTTTANIVQNQIIQENNNA